MGEMDGLNLVGFVKVNAAPVKPLDPQCKALIEQVDQGMKSSPEEQNALIGQPFKTVSEARKKARYINSQIPLMGDGFSRYIAKSKGNDQSGYQVCIGIRKSGHASRHGKGKGKSNA